MNINSCYVLSCTYKSNTSTSKTTMAPSKNKYINGYVIYKILTFYGKTVVPQYFVCVSRGTVGSFLKKISNKLAYVTAAASYENTTETTMKSPHDECSHQNTFNHAP